MKRQQNRGSSSLIAKLKLLLTGLEKRRENTINKTLRIESEIKTLKEYIEYLKNRDN